MYKFWLLTVTLFIPLYLFRLHSQPVYRIPAGEPVKIIGRISNQPYLKGSKQIIKVGPVTVQANRFPDYFYGQKIEAIGTFKKKVINPFKTDYIADYPAIRIIEKEQNPNGLIRFRQRLFIIRGHLERSICSLLNEPQASLLNGILLGVKKEMPTDFWQKLQKTGTLHIVVASGYNLSVVAGFLVSGLTFFVTRKKALVLALAGIVFYALMVGAEPPVVRAAVMAAIGFTAQILGREQDGLIALIFSAIVMLLASPLIIFDLGFQLSFAAMAGIILIEPLLARWGKIFRWRGIGPALSTTLAAQIGVTPLLLANFGQISFLSPLANALVLPVVPLIMNLGAVSVFTGLVFKPIGQIIAWLVLLPLTYFVKLIDLFSSIPFASIAVGKISCWWTVGYYLALGVTIWVASTKKSKLKGNF